MCNIDHVIIVANTTMSIILHKCVYAPIYSRSVWYTLRFEGQLSDIVSAVWTEAVNNKD